MLSPPPPPPNDIAPGRRPRAVGGGGDRPHQSSPARAEADPLLHDARVPPTQSRACMRRGKGGWLTRRCIAQRVLSLALPRTHLRASKKKGRTERARTRRQAGGAPKTPSCRWGWGGGASVCSAAGRARACARARAVQGARAGRGARREGRVRRGERTACGAALAAAGAGGCAGRVEMRVTSAVAASSPLSQAALALALE